MMYKSVTELKDESELIDCYSYYLNNHVASTAGFVDRQTRKQEIKREHIDPFRLTKLEIEKNERIKQTIKNFVKQQQKDVIKTESK